MTHHLTGDAYYNLPTKPRVRIYAFNDSTYTTPLFEYDPFTAEHGDPNAVTKLSFNTSMTNVGQCEIGIENNDRGLDIEAFRKSNRIKIDVSRGFHDTGGGPVQEWWTVFKGLRSEEHTSELQSRLHL